MQADGYLFFELYVDDLRHYVAIFEQALGFRVVEHDEDFVKLASSHGTVLLNATKSLPAEHPFAAYRAQRSRGMGVELGVVTRDLDLARTRALALQGCVVTEVTTQEWGDARLPDSIARGVLLPRHDARRRRVTAA